MLLHLQVKNFALIESLNLDVNRGFTVLTGETGAGKSILIDALGLVLGNKAEASVIQDKTKKCVVEATFAIEAYKLENYFKEEDVDYAAETIIRREISADGKSRAFVNDMPVKISFLKDLSRQLIDIHSQHQNILISEKPFQFSFVDAYADNAERLLKYQAVFTSYQKKKKELNELESLQNKNKKEEDFIRFQVEELDKLALKAGEYQALEEESNRMSNAETIKQALSKVSLAIADGEENTLTILSNAKIALQGISKFSSEYNELLSRIQSSIIELKDIHAECESYNEDVSLQPERLVTINLRLDELNRLMKKHGVNTDEALLTAHQNLQTQLDQLSNSDEHIETLRKEISSLLKDAMELANALQAERIKTLPKLNAEVEQILKQLSMPNAKFLVKLDTLESLDKYGVDQLQFLFAPNKGSEFQELHKIASGGEMARVMLAIKTILAKHKQLPTILFDEIDTGVSGEVASKMAELMRNMSKKIQVLTITHLPQIASRGENHWYVYKKDTKEKTVSNIKILDAEERINELAKMLSTGKVTEAAMNNAKEMIG